MKKILMKIGSIAIILLLGGCGQTEAKDIVADTYDSYIEMYYSVWQNLLGQSADNTVYAENGTDYMKLREEVSLTRIREKTDQICTEDFAEEEFYKKYLEGERPLLLEKEQDLYVLVAEMPGVGIGEIKEITILEKKKNYIHAKMLGEDFILGEMIADIVVVQEDGVWKVDSLETEVKE